MSVPRSGWPRKYVDRPQACLVCASAAWWNGWREVTRKHLVLFAHVEIQPEQRVHRAKCSKSKRGCSAPGWTVYPPGRYPYRRFDLDVVANAVATSAFDRDDEDRLPAFASIGRRYTCSGRTVSRWTHWIAELTDVEALARECIRMDPEGMPAATRPDTTNSRARAGWALAVLDRFAGLLETRAVLPRGSQPSLVRVLDDQRLRHGVRFPFRNHSPPLSKGADQTAPHGGG